MGSDGLYLLGGRGINGYGFGWEWLWVRMGGVGGSDGRGWGFGWEGLGNFGH